MIIPKSNFWEIIVKILFIQIIFNMRDLLNKNSQRIN